MDQARIDEALGGLRPAIAIKGSPAVHSTLADRMTALRVPGVAIAVIDTGRLAWSRGFGVKEAGGADSVTSETLFQAQSISKPVTATAMLRLVEAGKLSLDRDVNHYLVAWKVPANRFTAKEKVTLRRIASHNAGLTVGGFPGYVLGDSVPTLIQILEGGKPANTPPIVVDTFPGAISRYSGGGTLVMQELLIEVGGEPFPDLMRRLVLEPAGMTRSTFEQPLPVARRPEAASGHGVDGSVIRGKWPVHPEMAAGGLWTTAADLARWALDISDAWAERPAKLLSTPTARQMLTVQKAPFGLGPTVEGDGESLRFGHSGSNRGFKAELVMFPAAGKGAVVMTNGDGGATLIDEIFQSIAAAYDWPGYGQTERAVAALSSEQLAGLVGEYSAPGPAGAPVPIVVTLWAGRLYLDVRGFLPKAEIHPSSADSFFTLGGADIVFTRDRSGRATAVSLGGQIRATRVR